MSEFNEKIHPKPEDLEIKSSEELEEAKKTAGVRKTPETPREHLEWMQNYLEFAKKQGDEVLAKQIEEFIKYPAKYEAAGKVEVKRLVEELMPKETEIQLALETRRMEDTPENRYKLQKEFFATEGYFNWKIQVNKPCAEILNYPERVKEGRGKVFSFTPALLPGFLERIVFKEITEISEPGKVSPETSRRFEAFNKGFTKITNIEELGKGWQKVKEKIELKRKEIEKHKESLDYTNRELDGYTQHQEKRYIEDCQRKIDDEKKEMKKIENELDKILETEAKENMIMLNGLYSRELVDTLTVERLPYDQSTKIEKSLKNLSDLKRESTFLKTGEKRKAEEMTDDFKEDTKELLPALSFLRGGLEETKNLEETKYDSKATLEHLDEALYKIGIYEHVNGYYYDPTTELSKEETERLVLNHSQGIKKGKEWTEEKVEKKKEREKGEKLSDLQHTLREKEEEKQKIKNWIEDRKKSLEQLPEKINQRKEEIGKINDEIKELERQKTFLGKIKKEALGQIEKKKDKIGTLKEEVKNLEETLKIAGEDIPRFEKSLKKTEEEISNLHKEIEELEKIP